MINKRQTRSKVRARNVVARKMRASKAKKRKAPRPAVEHTTKQGHKQGLFTPKNPEKYNGDPNNIRYMSSWELSFDKFLDANPNVVRWSSEEIAIPYIKPTDGRVHRYYPDYWVEYKDKDGNIIHEIIEVKPDKQTRSPTTVGKNKKTQIYEQVTWAVNVAKWEACQQFCNKYNIKFRLLTEKQMFR